MGLNIFLFHLIFCFKCLTSLRLSLVGVRPNPMIRGQGARLVCNHHLEDQELYSLKWYKNGSEFYRYMPSQEEPTTIYNVPGVSIDLQYSNKQELYLSSVSLETEGAYRCEVSVEGDFETASHTVQAEVISLPVGPELYSQRSDYSAGDLVTVNCSALDSHPAPTLTWYINKVPVHTVRSAGYTAVTAGQQLLPAAAAPTAALTQEISKSTGLISSNLHLKFRLKSEHYQDNHVNLKCTAILGNFFFKSEEMTIHRKHVHRAQSEDSANRDVYVRDSSAPLYPGTHSQDQRSVGSGRSGGKEGMVKHIQSFSSSSSSCTLLLVIFPPFLSCFLLQLTLLSLHH